jgi:hypothetical protein
VVDRSSATLKLNSRTEIFVEALSELLKSNSSAARIKAGSFILSAFYRLRELLTNNS